MQYGEIFGITAIVCVVGALLGLFISGRHEHADEPAPTVDTDDTPTALIDAPTQASSTATIVGRYGANPTAAGPAPLRLGAQQRSTPRRISVGSWTFAGSSAVRLRHASQMNAFRPLGSTGRILSQSCNAVTLVFLC